MIPINCLICHEEIAQKATWTSLLLQADKVSCDQCFQTFKQITGSTCPCCNRPQETMELCSDCTRWENDPQWKNILAKNISVFEYNDVMKDVLSTFKFRGDAALVNVFKQTFVFSYKNHLSSQQFDAVLPIPLSNERLHERGFNQAKLLANFLPLPQLDALQRTHHEKQSKKSRHERLQAAHVFSVDNPSIIENKRILLVDDIYTTGSTIRHAAKQLIQNGAAHVSSLTLIRS
ncbi:ComF family protein [Metabacillus sediminilitoris]|uniref:ComF family protein n=1 Tax=Metabacillus sediminilitoris TaxID=2567941 RepID=UPI001D0DB7CA|nr:ComF family protein [Metabacillus sediminilitoris]